MEHRAVRDASGAVCAGKVGLDTLTIPRRQMARVFVYHLRLAVTVAQQQAVLIAFGVLIDDAGRIGEPRDVVEIELTCFEQFMDQRHDQQTVRARCDAEPVIGHSIVARADRIDADHARATAFDFANAHFDRVAVVIFSDAEQHEHFGVLPIRLAKFPERPAHGVDSSGGHVHRTKPPVGCVIWRAKPLRPKRCERLRLVAPCKERQLFGGFFADRF